MTAWLILHQASWFIFFKSLQHARFKGVNRLRLPHSARSDLEPSRWVIRDLREMLITGRMPSLEDWARLRKIPRPWGDLIEVSVKELRESGLPLVPTLERIEELLNEVIRSGAQARARTAQAWGQACVCGAFVPLTAGALYHLLPSVAELGASWWWISALSLLLSLLAMVWILGMSEHAKWAGLREGEREWWPAALCFGERLLAALRSGVAADLAWARAIPQLSGPASPLVIAWGGALWSLPGSEAGDARVLHTRSLLMGWGSQLRQSIQKSVMEGRPCTERIEASLGALKQEWNARVERELALLGNRTLKPLFLLVAPAMLLLILVALMSTLQEGQWL